MVRAFPRVAVWLAVLLLFAAGAAMADTANLTFVDGKTVSGTFAYDVTQNKIVSWNFVSTEFNGTTFDSTSVNSQCFGFPCGGLALTNPNGDVVYGFDSLQANGQTDEFDIVISCGGVQNCVQNILSQAGNGVGNSFAITTGQPTCNPNGGTCIAAGEQKDIFNCLGSSCQVLLAGNNFLTITDPPSPGDVVVDMTLSSAPVGTVLNGNGGNTGVPEPSTLLLSALGLGGLALKRFYS
jgi:hypothetical protein